jgi:hypothetical protein
MFRKYPRQHLIQIEVTPQQSRISRSISGKRGVVP